MPSHLEKLIRAIDEEIVTPDARVAIVSNGGHPDESSLLATRDGYLVLARALIAFVDQGDKGLLEPDRPGAWGDLIASAFYRFPSREETTLAGAYLMGNHDGLIAAMKTFLGNRVEGWENDPQFSAPAARRTTDEDTSSA